MGSLRGRGQDRARGAMVRAAETDRAEGLFDDPYAHAFLDAAADFRCAKVCELTGTARQRQRKCAADERSGHNN
jgi:O-methyltransferase involved in polyketide biosynthesis